MDQGSVEIGDRGGLSGSGEGIIGDRGVRGRDR
jgi:hypothetical protein